MVYAVTSCTFHCLAIGPCRRLKWLVGLYLPIFFSREHKINVTSSALQRNRNRVSISSRTEDMLIWNKWQKIAVGGTPATAEKLKFSNPRDLEDRACILGPRAPLYLRVLLYADDSKSRYLHWRNLFAHISGSWLDKELILVALERSWNYLSNASGFKS